MHIMRSGEPFTGLWSVWRESDGKCIPSCTITTTTANGLFKPIYDRMSIILPRELE